MTSHVHWKSGGVSETVLDRKYSYTAYLIATIVITMSVLESPSPIANLFKYDISYLWHASRGPFLILHVYSVCDVEPGNSIALLRCNVTLSNHRLATCQSTR